MRRFQSVFMKRTLSAMGIVGGVFFSERYGSNKDGLRGVLFSNVN